MGKPKTQRTEQLRQAAKRYTIAQEAQGHIEQHKFNRLVAQGVIRLDKEYHRVIDGAIIEALKGSGLEKVLPPTGPGLAVIIV